MLKIRPATVEDVPQVLQFIRGLAEYERAPQDAVATQEDLQRDGLSGAPRFCAVIAEWNGEPAADVFPEFTEASPCIEAEGLAHPLLSDQDAVRNDLRLGRNLHVLIISGSNMAGKSTPVQAVGI